MKKFTEKEFIVINIILEEGDGDSRKFTMKMLQKKINLSERQVLGVCTSLQKKGLIEMYRGDCYYDGGLKK